MNYNLALLGLIEIVTAVTIGIFILALTFKILQFVGKKYYDIQQSNLAYSIYTASIMFSAGYMVSSVIQPLVSSFRLLDRQDDSYLLALKYLAQGGLFISIAYFAAILIGLISAFMYSRLTPIDEFKEIKENNVGIALVISSIIITLTLLTKSGVALLIESIIPYPQGPPL
ncbi:MAG: DUF350 domain-containing protein [Cyclobacteriaceae bacterium]|nr:DUF350 domain-containing protein [Cyclobacteriaceae bacterium]